MYTKSLSPLRTALLLLAAGCLLNVATLATSVTITSNVTTGSLGNAVSPNFLGTSFGTVEVSGSNYTIRHTPANTQLIQLYQNLGIHHIRLSFDKFNTSTTDPTYPYEIEPTAQQIDDFFDFCALAGVTKVIWSFPLRFVQAEGAWDYKAIANYIWNRAPTTIQSQQGTSERQMLEAFAFDNEPDLSDTNSVTGVTTPRWSSYTSYRTAWEAAATNVAAQTTGSITTCPFAGPDCFDVGKYNGKGGSNGTTSWTVLLAQDLKAANPRYNLIEATNHVYIGGPGHTGQTDGGGIGSDGPAPANYPQPWTQYGWANWLLENHWNDQPPTTQTINGTTYNWGILASIDSYVHPVSTTVPAFRYTESEFFAQGNLYNTIFATGLSYLDFLRMAARHNVTGVDAMSATASPNAPIYWNQHIPTPAWFAEPRGYAQLLFTIGSAQGGNVLYNSAVTISGAPSGLTAYSVLNTATNPKHLCVTVINKTSSSSYGASDFIVTFSNLNLGFTPGHVSITTLASDPNPTNSQVGQFAANAATVYAYINGNQVTPDAPFSYTPVTHTKGDPSWTDGNWTGTNLVQTVYSATAVVFDFTP